MSTPTTENLRREIGPRALTLAILNATIGTGIFVVTGLVGGRMGPAAIIAYVICGIMISLIALCFAELGSKTNISGGVYTYIESAFGPFAGFIANNIYWVGACAISDAVCANAIVNTLRVFFPAFYDPMLRVALILLLFAGLALLNISSVRKGIRFVEIATIAKIIPLLFIVFGGISHVLPGQLTLSQIPPVREIGATCLLLSFSFVGMETPLASGGEIKNPRRTVPVAIFTAISIVLVLYISLQLITQGVLGDAIASKADAPLAAVATEIAGPPGMTLIVIATLISIIGILSGDLLCIPRILFAGARDGLFPRVLSRVHPVFKTPYVAIITYATVVSILAIIGNLEQLAILASASMLLCYFGVAIATLVLRKKEKTGTDHFRTPGGSLVPILAAMVTLWLLSGLSRAEFIGISIFIGVLVVIYFTDFVLRKSILRTN